MFWFVLATLGAAFVVITAKGADNKWEEGIYAFLIFNMLAFLFNLFFIEVGSPVVTYKPTVADVKVINGEPSYVFTVDGNEYVKRTKDVDIYPSKKSEVRIEDWSNSMILWSVLTRFNATDYDISSASIK